MSSALNTLCHTDLTISTSFGGYKWWLYGGYLMATNSHFLKLTFVEKYRNCQKPRRLWLFANKTWLEQLLIHCRSNHDFLNFYAIILYKNSFAKHLKLLENTAFLSVVLQVFLNNYTQIP